MLQNLIASAPSGRDAIAGTVAILFAVAEAHMRERDPVPTNNGGGSMAAHRRAEVLRRLVQLALSSLLHECDDKRCRHLPWDMWFDESLVKDGPEDFDASEWASAVDEASGKTYYYNSKTGRSSWVWPPVPRVRADE